MKTTTVCQICNKEFTRVHDPDRNPRFCSRGCSNRSPERRTPEARKAKGRPGHLHPNYRGGWISRGSKGNEYFKSHVLQENRHLHPTINDEGYINRSHLIWNIHHPNDPVLPGQIIHHINNKSLDDRIENLAKANSQSEHLKMYHAADWAKSRNRKRGKNGRYMS